MITMDMTAEQFRQAFRTDRQCMRYLFARKYPDGFQCRRCNHHRCSVLRHRGGSWECQKCHYQESAKAGTLFHKSKIPLRKWFQGILEFTISKGGISAMELQIRLGFGCYETAWQMLHKLRMAMGRRDQQYTLQNVIEFDGTSFGNRHQGKKSKFYLAVEQKQTAGGKLQAGFAKHLRVERHGKKEVPLFMGQHVAWGTRVKTDGARAIEDGMVATDLTHDAKPMYGFKGQLDKHLPWIHRLISNIKTKLRGVYHGVSPKYVDRYIDEYLYRFNRRWWRNQLQTRMITACLTIGPVSYADTTR